MSARTVSTLALRLACGGLVALAAPFAFESVAYAQTVPGAAVFDGPILEILRPTDLVGDGASPADVYLLAIGPDGKPITGLKGKPTVSGGTATDLVETGGGLYRFTLTPGKTETATALSITFKGKVQNNAVSRTWNVSVAPPRSHQMAISSNPASLTLNADPSSSLALNLTGPGAGSLQGGDLKVRVSSGSVENVTSLGTGLFNALYKSPTVNYPHVAMVTAVDSRDPSHTYGALAVPLVGKADYPVVVAPNARVIIRVAGREFGPVAADASGHAKVPIIVPPGANNATKVQILDGKVTEEPLDLKIPEARRISLFPTATAFPSDGRLQIPVRVFVATPDGRPDESAQVVFSTTAGVIGQAKHEGAGVYVANYTPPFGNAATQATIAVNLADKPGLQSDSLTVNLVPARAAKVALSSEPSSLAAGADGFKVFAKVTGPDGNGLGGRDVSFAANGARLKGDVKDLRNGDYQAQFGTTGSGPVELTSAVASTPTGNPLARVLVVPARQSLLPDGLSSAMLTVVTVDEFGYPVPNVDVQLRLTSGDGSVPPTATTGKDGVAQVYYTAGRKAGFVGIEAVSGDRVGGASLVQAPAGVTVPSLPVSAAKPVAAIEDEWAGSLAGIRLEREGVSGTQATAPVVLAPVAMGTHPSKVSLQSDAASVTAGGTVTLRINLTDDGGRGVPGQKLEFLTSAGSVGAVQDLGGGQYQASFTVPAGASGEAKISVATSDGSASSFLKVPIAAAASTADAWGANPFTSPPEPTNPTPTAATPPAPATTTTASAMPATAPTLTPPGAATTSTTTITRTPTTLSQRPWLRIQVGYTGSGYSYDQKPLQSPVVALFPTAVDLSAVAQGGSASVTAWVPNLPWVGVEVNGRLLSYSFPPQALCEKLDSSCDDAGNSSDAMLSVQALAAGRYVFDAGDNQFYVGAHVGYGTSDVQAFEVTTQAGKQQISLVQLYVGGLAVGPEIGAELGKKTFLKASFTENLVSGPSHYDTHFGLTGGYALVDHAFVGLSYDLDLRDATLVSKFGEDLGEITDTTHAVSVNVGTQF